MRFSIYFTKDLAIAGLAKVLELEHRALLIVSIGHLGHNLVGQLTIGHPVKGLQVVQVPLELHLHRDLTWSLSVCVLLVEDLRRPSK